MKKIRDCVYKEEKLLIFASEKLLEDMKKDKCIQQGLNITKLPGMRKHACIMPDGHQGYGFPIGGVAAFSTEDGCISPGGVGYDINCGVRIHSTNLNKDQIYPKINELLNTLFKNIPCGVGSESEIYLNEEQLNQVLNTGIDWAIKNNYATQEDKNNCEENGRMQTANADKVSTKAKKRGKNQLGTLGAGNHFLEISYVDKIYDKEIAEIMGIKENQVTLMIHSGSRGLGHQVCSDYLRKIQTDCKDIEFPDQELVYAPANSELANDYLKAMSAAANFGWCNRQLMTYFSRKSFKEIFPDSKISLIYDVAHNICKVEEHIINNNPEKLFVHRKGATRAFPPNHPSITEKYKEIGQPILIPGTMGTSSYVLVGTETAMEDTFGSTPHGAGRVLSRAAAKKQFKGEEVKEQLEKEKIYIKAKSWKGISEEAPKVYKDVDEVVNTAVKAGIGKLVFRVKPIGVLKG